MTDIEIEGVLSFARVRIPAGVTVTVTGDLVLRSAGDFTVDGTVRGECVSIELSGANLVRLAGTVDGACAGRPPDEPPGLAIISGGQLTLSGSTLRSSGSIEISGGDESTAQARVSGSNAFRPSQTPSLVVQNARIQVLPEQAPDGVRGAEGGNGIDGSGVLIRSTANVEFLGVNQIRAQDGGQGGEGNISIAGPAEASGGDGGAGGRIRVESGSTIRFVGPNHTFRPGSGGSGGNSLAESLETDGATAPEAVASGGRGGDAGPFRVLATGGISATESIEIVLGNGGSGGVANALSADGRDADADPAQSGGSATAIAGRGGNASELDLAGSIEFALVVSGGDGGVGGSATALAGNGGLGNAAFPAGGVGGSVEAISANGGDAGSADVGGGGDSGLVIISGGNGGEGFSSTCDPAEAGGPGGPGGTARAVVGTPGTGASSGEPGSVTIVEAGNGGNGGRGEPSGPGGSAGESEMADDVELLIENSFQTGEDGPPCPSPAMIFDVLQVMVTGGNTSLDSQVGYRNVRVLEVTITGNEILITEPVDDPVFVPLLGTIDPGGNITAEGRGEVAGQNDVLVTATGSLGATGILALDLTVGANKSLPPNGLPILYLLTARVRP